MIMNNSKDNYNMNKNKLKILTPLKLPRTVNTSNTNNKNKHKLSESKTQNKQCDLGSLTQRENIRRRSILRALLTPRINEVETKTNQNIIRPRPKQFNRVVDHINCLLYGKRKSKETYRGRELQNNLMQRHILEAGKVAYFRFYLQASDLNHAVRFNVELQSGTVAMYISTHSIYSGNNRDYQWHANIVRSKSIDISVDDPYYTTGYYYVSIVARHNSHFTICASIIQVRTKNDSENLYVPNRRVIQRNLKEKIAKLRSDHVAMEHFQKRIDTITARQHRSAPVHRDVVERNKDVDKFTPRLYENYKRNWFMKHNKKVERVLEKHEMETKRKKDAQIEKLESRDLRRRERKRTEYESKMRAERQKFQRRWLIILSSTIRNLYCHQQIKNVEVNTLKFLTIKVACRKIQRFVRARMAIKRERKSKLCLIALKTLFRLCTNNYHMIKKHRAADVLKCFLEQITGVESVSRVVRNFRRRIVFIQRLIRKRLQTRYARLKLWGIQWDNVINDIANGYIKHANITEAEAHSIPEVIKRRVLEEHMLEVLRDVREQVPNYHEAVEEWKHRMNIEAARRMVLTSNSCSVKFTSPPLRPHAPPLLRIETLLELMQEAKREYGKMKHMSDKVDKEIKTMYRAAKIKVLHNERVSVLQKSLKK